mmetsp:Transcript_17257/g.30411  ORF Transcript_17257/g.30411 Transcript_17257/m.30411 type:complete len:126 (-) Transcript_17257:89-466(-)
MRVIVDFNASLLENVLDGKKRATTRWQAPSVNTPCTALVTSQGVTWGELRITSVQKRTSSEVRDDQELAQIEELGSGQELLDLLYGFYPEMPRNDTEELQVFYFDSVKRFSNEQQLESQPGDVQI